MKDPLTPERLAAIKAFVTNYDEADAREVGIYEAWYDAKLLVDHIAAQEQRITALEGMLIELYREIDTYTTAKAPAERRLYDYLVKLDYDEQWKSVIEQAQQKGGTHGE